MHKNTSPLWVSNTKAKTGNIGIATEPAAEARQYAGLHVKKALQPARYWFFDNAAPIPGVSFVTKRKMLWKKENKKFMDIFSMLGIYSKKQMKALFSFSKNWNSFMVIESMLKSNIRKGFMAVNAQDRLGFALAKAVARDKLA